MAKYNGNFDEFNRKRTEENNKKRDTMENYICMEGEVTIKDIAVELKYPADFVRRMVKELYENGRLGRRQVKRSYVYFIAKPEEEKKEDEPVKEEENKVVMPVNEDGKELDPGTYIPVTDNCKPGDVIWISSRSGDGQFFRYLIITPWERKAMVLGTIREGSPTLNVNDPNHVYIGNDPETGEGLYADLRNVCQRGYKQFGERLMHIDKDYLDDVRCRLARSIGIKRTSDSQPYISRLENQLMDANKTITKLKEGRDFLSESLKKLGEEGVKERNILLNQVNDLKAQLDVAYNKRNEFEREIADLRLKLEDAYKETEKAKQLADTIQKERDDMIEEYDRMYEELNASEAKTNEAERSANQELILSMQEEIEKLQKTLGALVQQDCANKAKVELLEKQNDTLTKMVFCMIKGGKND